MIRKLLPFVVAFSCTLKTAFCACESSELSTPDIEVFFQESTFSDDYSSPNTAFSVKCSRDLKSEFVWNGICRDGRYVFSRDGVIMRETMSEYCANLFSTCLVSNAHPALRLLANEGSNIRSYRPGSFVFFKCDADRFEFDAIKGGCSSDAVWEYSAEGKAIAWSDMEDHCSRYSAGCAIRAIDSLLVLAKAYPDVLPQQAEGAELAVKCSGDSSRNAQKAVCRSAAWEYYDLDQIIIMPLEHFCYRKTHFCHTEELEPLLYESEFSQLTQLGDMKSMPVHCKSNVGKSDSLSARCEGRHWKYLIWQFEIDREELEVFCRDSICLKHKIPLKAVVLMNAPYIFKDYIYDKTVISAKCVNVPNHDFEIECRGDTLVYTQNGVEIPGSIEEYCNGLVEEISGCYLRDIDGMFSKDTFARLGSHSRIQATVYCALDSEKSFAVLAKCDGKAWKYSRDNAEASLDSLAEFCGELARKGSDEPVGAAVQTVQTVQTTDVGGNAKTEFAISGQETRLENGTSVTRVLKQTSSSVLCNGISCAVNAVFAL